MEWKRATARMHKVAAAANLEAQMLNHEYVGTEHFLLGLLKADHGVGAQALKDLGKDLFSLRVNVENLLTKGNDVVTMGQLPLTHAATVMLERAEEECEGLGHRHIGTEHLLLALCHQTNPMNLAAEVLVGTGVRLDDVRQRVVEILGGGHSSAVEKSMSLTNTASGQ